MDNYNEQPLLLTGGLTADELPEGRAVYDTNDKFQPTGKDLVSGLSWIPGPVGGVAGGIDAWNQLRDQNIDPLLAGTAATAVGALGTLGLGKLTKFLPKGKRGGYLRLGPTTKSGKQTVLSDTGGTFEFGTNADVKAIIDDANTWQKHAEATPKNRRFLYWYNDVDDLNQVPDDFILGMDRVDIDSYSGALPEIPKDTVYHHFSNTLFNKPEKGHLGLRAGDNLDIGPAGGLYLTDDSTTLDKFNYGYNVLGPSEDKFFLNSGMIDDNPVLLDYINKKGLNREWFRGLDNSHLINSNFPYINRFLRKKGYAGKTDIHGTWPGRTKTPFQQYATFDPNDTIMLNRIKSYNNLGVLR